MSFHCVDLAFGTLPKDLRLTNLKGNDTAALNKIACCKLVAEIGDIVDLGATNLTVTNLTADNINVVNPAPLPISQGSITAIDCGVPATWTVTGSVSKVGTLVILNTILVRNAPGILAPCNPAALISAGFAPAVATTLPCLVTSSMGNPTVAGTVTIDTSGNVDTSSAPTTDALDIVVVNGTYLSL